MPKQARIHPSHHSRGTSAASRASIRLLDSTLLLASEAPAQSGGESPEVVEQRHWLWLTFHDNSLEEEFQVFLIQYERISLCTASVILLFLSIAVLVVAALSVSYTSYAALAWTVPQVINIILFAIVFVATFCDYVFATQLAGLLLIFHNVMIKPIWTPIFQSAAVGPSVSCVIFQSMIFMVFPLNLKYAFYVSLASIMGLLISVSTIISQLQATGDVLSPISGYMGRFSWASAFVIYLLVVSNAWIYLRLKQRALRKLFLLRRRKAKMYKTLESKGIPAPKHSVTGLWRGPPQASRSPASRSMYSSGIYNNSMSPFDSTRKVTSSYAYSSGTSRFRPNTGHSIVTSTQEDEDEFPTKLRPTSAFFRFVNQSKVFDDSNLERSFGRGKRDKDEYPLNIRALKSQDVEPEWKIVSLFLGQAPWPTYNERRYLRHQARIHSESFLYAMVRLFCANFTCGLLDHFDRVANASLSTQTTTGYLLLQTIPFAGIPLIAIPIALILCKLNKMLLIQPLVLLTYWGLAAAYLLSPMEQLSTVYPDAIPQSKMTAYLVATIILVAQSGLIPARSFVPWCMSIVFLAITHIPLVASWGGNYSSVMPWGMALQVAILVIFLSPLVRACDAIGREAFEALQTIKCCIDLVKYQQVVQQQNQDFDNSTAVHGIGPRYSDPLAHGFTGYNADPQYTGLYYNPYTEQQYANYDIEQNPTSQKLQSLLDQCDAWIMELISAEDTLPNGEQQRSSVISSTTNQITASDSVKTEDDGREILELSTEFQSSTIFKPDLQPHLDENLQSFMHQYMDSTLTIGNSTENGQNQIIAADIRLNSPPDGDPASKPYASQPNLNSKDGEPMIGATLGLQKPIDSQNLHSLTSQDFISGIRVAPENDITKPKSDEINTQVVSETNQTKPERNENELKDDRKGSLTQSMLSMFNWNPKQASNPSVKQPTITKFVEKNAVDLDLTGDKRNAKDEALAVKAEDSFGVKETSPPGTADSGQTSAIKSSSLIGTDVRGPRLKLLGKLDDASPLIDTSESFHHHARPKKHSADTSHGVLELDHPMHHTNVVEVSEAARVSSITSSATSMGPAYLGLTPPATSQGRNPLVPSLGASGPSEGRRLPALTPIHKPAIPNVNIPSGISDFTIVEEKQ